MRSCGYSSVVGCDLRSRSSQLNFRVRLVLCRYSAPVDCKCDAVHEAGIITGEEDDRRSKFLGLSNATCWCQRCELTHHLLGDCFHHAGARRAGGNGVDPDTTRAVFGGPGLRQQFESRPAGAIQSHAGLSEAGDHRGDVDDRAPSAFGHGWGQGRDEEERYLDVQCKTLVELCFGSCAAWSEQGDASVVDEDVDMTAGCLSGPLD